MCFPSPFRAYVKLMSDASIMLLMLSYVILPKQTSPSRAFQIRTRTSVTKPSVLRQPYSISNKLHNTL